MIWRSVKKFCSDEYPGMVFRNDAARKVFVIRQGLKLQADDAGIEGVVTAKDSDDVKELKVGKRIAASKIRAQNLEDAADMSREQINQMHAKNAAQLAVEVNDEAGFQCQLFVIKCCLATVQQRNYCVSFSLLYDYMLSAKPFLKRNEDEMK